MELPASGESGANLNKTTSFWQRVLNPKKILKNICPKKLNRLIFAHLNIDSIGNKFDSLVAIANKNIDVFLISEFKIGSSIPY